MARSVEDILKKGLSTIKQKVTYPGIYKTIGSGSIIYLGLATSNSNFPCLIPVITTIAFIKYNKAKN